MSEEEIEENYIKICGHKLTFDEAYKIKRSIDEMIKEWDFIIKKDIPFNEQQRVPNTMCLCPSNIIVPIDYFTSDNGEVIMCGACKVCGGYKEYISADYEYPFNFKSPPKWRGLFIIDGKLPNKTPDMYI